MLKINFIFDTFIKKKFAFNIVKNIVYRFCAKLTFQEAIYRRHFLLNFTKLKL